MISNQNPTPRLAILICYFGKLPNYFSLVEKSISKNFDIDWHLFTDDQSVKSDSSNLTIHQTTLSNIVGRLSEAARIPIELSNPYHLCSLRPAFGEAFQDIIKNCEFWSYSDLDVIFGDIRSFLPANMMQYDRVFARGHMSFFRNKLEINQAFLLEAPGAVSFAQVAARPELGWQFDEWPGIWKIFRYHNFPQYHAEVIADIKPPNLKWITRFEAEELQNYPNQVFYWHQGKTFQSYYHREGGLFDHEVAYVHFQKRKFPPPSSEALTAPGFLIGPEGFSPYDRENLSPREMDQLNANRRRPWRDVMERRILRLKRKLATFQSRAS